MDKKERYLEVFRKNGYKLTTQRRVIFEVLYEHSNDHPSPEEIYERVIGKYPEIGLATIYRTLQLMEDLGIVYKMNFNDGLSHYELCMGDSHQHHHLICLQCGRIEEVEIDLLEELEASIEENKGFKITDHSVKFFGICKHCQTSRSNKKEN
jgi:Fur family ferric uptake transcriptional regulator